MAGVAEKGNSTPEPAAEAFNISPEECVRRLRQKGQPIRLFGETDKDRKLRLRALELLEERSEGTQNDFKRTLEAMEYTMEEKNLGKEARLAHAKAKAAGEASASTSDAGEGEQEGKKGYDGGILDLKLVQEDPNKLYPIMYYALKVGTLSVSSLHLALTNYSRS